MIPPIPSLLPLVTNRSAHVIADQMHRLDPKLRFQIDKISPLFSSSFSIVPKPRFEEEEKRGGRSGKNPKAPIGLQPVDSEGKVNAFLQFILFVPHFVESFSFIAKSWQIIQEFFDQYRNDQREQKSVCSLSAEAIFCFLEKRMGSWEILELCDHLFSLLGNQRKIESSFAAALENGGKKDFFFLAVEDKKQFFTEQGQGYELSAFIEKRPDGSAKVSYVTYGKIRGIWYQCDDRKIKQVYSHQLPINRMLLSHFRPIYPT